MTSAKKRIVFFGDSITEMGNMPGGYVSIVRDSLKNFEIIGTGISGNKVSDLEKRLRKDVLDKKPDCVVMYIGINDVWHYQFADRGLSGTPKDSFSLKLKNIINKIQQAGSTVILCTPSVIGEKTGGSNPSDAMLDEYSGISRIVAQEAKVHLLDLRKEFLSYLLEHNSTNSEHGILTTDGVHLSAEGNRFVALQMIKGLKASRIF